MDKKKNTPDFPAIGENLRRERRKQRLTLESLASASGVSKAMLSQIEADKVNPTIGTLWKIAHALKIDFDPLLRGDSGKARLFDVTRAENVAVTTTDSSSAVFRVYSPLNMAESLELYRVTLAPGCLHRSLPHTAGTEEFITVLEGEIIVTAGERSAELKSGDFIAFQSDVEHCLENRGTRPAELYMAVRFL